MTLLGWYALLALLLGMISGAVYGLAGWYAAIPTILVSLAVLVVGAILLWRLRRGYCSLPAKIGD